MPTLSIDAEGQSARYPRRFGKFVLLSRLAQGGMGEVFAAILPGAAGFEKKLVIKRILPHLAEDARFVTLFLSEARLTASLQHPNICQVFELGEIDGQYFLSMEYLEGVALSRLLRLRLGQGVELDVACGVISQAAEGLEHAHRFRDELRGLGGIIHRDISPANLFVTTSGVIKVLDFGVAKVSAHASTTVTGLKGKYPYMSPEQIRGLELDPRSDVFSLGVVLWETLAGRTLFVRDNEFDSLQAIVGGIRPSLAAIRPSIPPALERVVERALAVEREERFDSAADLAQALREAADATGGVAPPSTIARFVEASFTDEIEQTRELIHSALSAAKARTPSLALTGAAAASDQPTATTAGLTTAARPSHAIGSSPRSSPHRSRHRGVVPLALIVAAAAGAVGAWQLRGSAPAPGPRMAPTVRPAPSTIARAAIAPLPATAAPVTPAPVTPAPAPAPAPAPETSVPTSSAPHASHHRDKGRDDGHAKPPPARPSGTGYLSIDATPFAEVYVDGTHIGTTPLVKIPVASGSHHVRLIGENGHQKTFDVVLEPGGSFGRRVTLE